jgi:hypothetical protein
MMMMFRVGQIHRHNSHQTCSGHCPLAYRIWQYTQLQEATEESDSEAPDINYHSTPLSVFMLYLAQIIALLVVETKRGSLDEGPSLQPHITEV